MQDLAKQDSSAKSMSTVPKISTYFNQDLFETLIDQVETAVTTSGGRKNNSRWVISNTSDPLNPHKQWSFHRHEYQIGIMDSEAPRNYIMKVSQIGVSEAIVRLVLALLAKMPGRQAIYTLPDSSFAKVFSPSRFDPVVEASKKLRALVEKELNNQRVKKIGSSYLHITGSSKETNSISVPASILIHDEFAYSEPGVLGTFNSRLGHLAPGEEIVYAFSTPLFPNSDIHEAFLQGTQDLYMVYHKACNQWVALDPMHNLVIPGYSGPPENFSKADLLKINPDEAYIQCPHCSKKVSLENMGDSSCRAWVPTFPEREYRSFDANYLVAPIVKPPSKVLRARKNYRSTAKWLNFEVGRPADSSDNRISDSSIDRAFSVQGENSFSLTTVGMDVGKTGHIIVLHKAEDTYIVSLAERVQQNENNQLAIDFSYYFKTTKATKGVIDAGPEFTVVKKVQSELPFNRVFGCYFVRGADKQNLSFYSIDEDEGLIKAQRTKAFNELVEDFNQGKILFYKGMKDEDIIRKHLKNLVRVDSFDPLGEEKVVWKSLGEDHYLFALFYAWLAAQTLEDQGNRVPLGAVKMMSKTKMRA